MRFGALFIGGIGDLIIYSLVTRALARAGHHVVTWMSVDALLSSAAAAARLSDLGTIQMLPCLSTDDARARLAGQYDRLQLDAKTYPWLWSFLSVQADAHVAVYYRFCWPMPEGSRAEQYAQMIADYGGPLVHPDTGPRWVVEAWETDAVQPWVAAGGSSLPLIYLASTAHRIERTLPPDVFGRLLTALEALPARVVVDHVGEFYLRRAGRPDVRHVAELPINLRAAIINAADLCLSVDTGVLHIALALGRPTLGMFGSTTPQAVCADYSGCPVAPVTRHLPCAGCFCQLEGGYQQACKRIGCAQLSHLDIAGTAATIERLLNRGGRHQSGGPSVMLHSSVRSERLARKLYGEA